MTLIEQLKHIIESNGLTQAKVAKELGFTSAVLSAYINGKYSGNNQTVEQAIRAWIENRAKKAQVFVEAPQFIETNTAKGIWQVLDMSKLLSTMVTIFGASGVGKTQSAREYAKRNSNVWMITASPARATLSSILYEMALELGINDAPRRKDKLSRLIVKKLTGTAGLMIIDEADHLPYDALEEIRIIQEETNIGFALIGNDKVYTRIQGGVNQAHEYARLWSRIGKHKSVKKCTKNDIKAIATAWQLDTQDKDLMKVLYDIGGAAGGLRALTQYLRLAGISAKGNGTTITLDLIMQAQAQMQGAN
ncbi:AAA family ATPase [Pasteurellaceae bacterium HPA106]|uniref:AAA family ATPase n=1 Tax=Spirabiliibacterium pneumoniae TaxID=221400 RepID=UPI001AAD9768|nr:AAA family ATPase [Spirabiliibacterium pneumoniae]MBE2896765.1 AAA family ATPase [Spirabiliibacterium pneumoniae]